MTTEPPKVVAVVPPMATPKATVASVQTLETVEPASVATATTNESGPRVAGARRSTERIRKKSTPVTDVNKDDTSTNNEQ